MFWQDVLLGCLVEDTALVHAVAAALGLADDSVRVVDAVSDLNTLDEAPARVLVESSELKGEFPLHLSIYVRDSELARELRSSSATLDRVKRLCKRLRCPALVSDDSLSPSAWLRVSPSRGVERVSLDAERLDHDEFVVAAAAPANLHETPLVP